MKKPILIALAAAGLSAPTVLAQANVTAGSAARTTATSYCRSLHHDHPAAYHHRYGHDRRSFGRCTDDWRHDHAGHHHSEHNQDHD